MPVRSLITDGAPAVPHESAVATHRSRLDECVEELAPLLLRLLLARSGGDQELAEELAQDALLSLVERWRRVGPPRDPAAFAATIARRRLDRRVLRRRLSRPIETLFGKAAQDVASDERAAGRQRVRFVVEAMAGLRRTQRRALELRLAGFDLASIAQAERVSVGTVKMRLLRARQALQRCLQARETVAPRSGLRPDGNQRGGALGNGSKQRGAE